MIIGPSDLRFETESAVLHTPFEDVSGTHDLWHSVPEEYGGHLQATDNLDAQRLGLLLRAMSMGEDITLIGKISERLYYSLTTYVMHLLTRQTPGLKIVSLYPEGLE